MTHLIKIQNEDDIYLSLYYSKLVMNGLSFTEMEKQMVLVTVSELTRNILDHAGKGSFSCESVDNRGIKVIVQDKGKGIEQLGEILNGASFENKKGLGLGLIGAKRMMDEFTITTSKEGTKIVCIKWEGSPKKV